MDGEKVEHAIYRSRFVLSLPRRRTALHMAIGTKNVRMVRALMRWRHELNRSLDDELDALDHRRDMFVQGVTLASTNATAIANARGGESAGTSVKDVERFAEWLFEERRRLVRVTELRCEENWHKAMAARDDKGRTSVHWAASGKPEGRPCSHPSVQNIFVGRLLWPGRGMRLRGPWRG